MLSDGKGVYYYSRTGNLEKLMTEVVLGTWFPGPDKLVFTGELAVNSVGGLRPGVEL